MKGYSIVMPPEQESLFRFAEAFYGLARRFQDMPCQKERLGEEDIRTLFDEIRCSCCAVCAREVQCWDHPVYGAGSCFYEMLQELESRGQYTGEQLNYLQEQCQNAQEVAAALWESYGQARVNLFWKNRLLEQRTAVGEQIYQTAELLRRVGERMSGNPAMEQTIKKRLEKELKHLGIELLEVRVLGSGENEKDMILTLRTQNKKCISIKTVAKLLSKCCREEMRPACDCSSVLGREFENYHFVKDTKYQILCGIARMTKDGELISGDNYSLLQKDTGKVVMSLADGKGSGLSASRESEKVLEILEQFLEAGFPQETAVRMMNSCLLLQNQDQMFSTIDLCMIDLYNAKCDMIKAGAASTFIRSGNEVEVISSETLPFGILQQSEYESVHRQLREGDSVIMVTDGVLDALPSVRREEIMVELIQKCASGNAKEYARKLMERVYMMEHMQARDDMTILVGSMWKK